MIAALRGICNRGNREPFFAVSIYLHSQHELESCFRQLRTKMSSSSASFESLVSAIETRRSIYTLKKESPVSNDRLTEIVQTAVKHSPSAFNVQSARAVILFGGDHEQLWSIADAQLKKAMPEPAYQALAPKVAGLKAAYGTVMWFEDQADLDALKSKNAAIQHVVPECVFTSFFKTLPILTCYRVGSFQRLSSNFSMDRVHS